MKKATRIPDWILTIKGKADGRKGADIANTYTDKIWSRHLALEQTIVRKFECSAKGFRQKGADILLHLNDQQENPQETSVNAERTLRAHADEKQKLIEVNQEIIDVNAALWKALQKLERETMAKINAYIYGIKKKLPDFSSVDFMSASYENYIEYHRTLDEAIAAYANKFV